MIRPNHRNGTSEPGRNVLLALAHGVPGRMGYLGIENRHFIPSFSVRNCEKARRLPAPCQIVTGERLASFEATKTSASK